MPWSGRYYYRSIRVNGRPRRQYVGAGRIGQLASQLDSAEQERKVIGQSEANLVRQAADDLDADLLAIEGLADVLVRAALAAAGFHQHHRGEWRRKREAK